MGEKRQNSKKTDNEMISRLFFSMLPVQIVIFAMGSINSIVDGAIAGRFIDATTVGVIGLYYSMVNILNAVGSVLLGGTPVLCGKYLGRGDFKKTEGIFSLNLTVTLLIGALITAISFIMPGSIATMLGASEELKADLVTYTVGYAIGIIPMLLAQQIASFLQLERQSTIGYIGVVGMIVSNITLDIVLVAVLRWGIWGLALATSLSNLIYFLILVPYYFTSRAQLHYNIKNALWGDLGNLVTIGFPGALLVFCLSLRGMVINRMLLTHAGNDGLSAMAAYNMVNGILIAYCLGNGSVLRMLISVFVGEEDKYSMRKILKIVLTKGLAVSAVFAGFIIAISPLIAMIFFPERTSNVYHQTHQLLVIIALCIPLILICQVSTNYFQAMEHKLFVNFVSVFDGFFSMVIPAMILAPILGALGIWLANPIGIVMTILMVPIYCTIYWKHFPRNLDEWMVLPSDFGVPRENLLDISIHDMDELMQFSEQTQEFCSNNGMGKRASYYSALCLEEMAGNVITHGFSANKKKNFLNSMVIFKDGSVILRIKDDCIPFNPLEMAQISNGLNEFKNIGISMINKIADEMTYQNMLGLNVLTITVNKDNMDMDSKESESEIR